MNDSVQASSILADPASQSETNTMIPSFLNPVLVESYIIQQRKRFRKC